MRLCDDYARRTIYKLINRVWDITVLLYDIKLALNVLHMLEIYNSSLVPEIRLVRPKS